MPEAEQPPLYLFLIGGILAVLVVSAVALVLRRGADAGGNAARVGAAIIVAAAIFAVLGTLQPIAKGLAIAGAAVMVGAAFEQVPARVAVLTAAAIIPAAAYVTFFGHHLAHGQDFTALLVVPMAASLGAMIAIAGMAVSALRPPPADDQAR